MSDMCKQGDTKILTLPNKKEVSVDSCIYYLLKILNENYKSTIASCCGHGKQPTRISFADHTEIFIARDYDEATKISKSFPPIN